MAAVANVNGRITPASQASVSVLDRSFLFGDGVYESLRTYGGNPFLLPRHLERLSYSAARLQIPLPLDPSQIASRVEETVAAGGHPESFVRIILSRGEGWLSIDPRQAGPPNLVILVQEMPTIPAEVYRDGVAAVVVDVRRNAIASLDPRIKSNNLLNNLLASMQAVDRGAPEGILLNLDGDLAEATNANVFTVFSGAVLTPPLECGILEGITRQVILELCGEATIPCREEHIAGARLPDAAEIFLTSTTREVLPVVRLDDRPVGDGRPGPVAGRLLELYRERAASG
jgi:branched-chain amino acid aminotransferase